MIFGKNVKIIFAGDSITDAGATRNEPDTLGGGYPRYVRDYLYSKYPEFNFSVINKGISGERTCNLLNRFESDVLSLQPDFLSILIGTNDVWRQFDNPDMDVIDQTQFEENIRKMLLLAQKYNKDMPILLFEIPPIEPGFDTYACSKELETKGNTLINEYNKSIYKLAYEFKTYLCPINKMLKNNIHNSSDVKYTVDGVHPNSTGSMATALSWCNLLGL